MLMGIFLILLVSGNPASAQMPGGMGGKTAAAPSIGHFYGKIVSDSSARPIDGASVVLLVSKFDTVSKKRKEVLVKALVTKSNGEFSFEELPMFGNYKLKVSAIGYKNLEQSLNFQLKMPGAGGAAPKSQGASGGDGMAAMSSMLNGVDRDLGNLKMVTDSKQLESVTVTARKPTLRMDIDKKVYNVEKDIVNAGGTAQDIMKNVPSVNVDIDGNVTLRNSTPQIYIDGRPTTLSLDQIPADAIESVEVITNPSAKYDASGGGAGILNIVLKKNRKTGYNGMVRAGVNTRGGLNGGANINLRQNKFNFSAAAFVNQDKGLSRGTTDRTNIADTASTLHQYSREKNNGAFEFGSIGMDYFLSNRTTLSLTGIKVHGQHTPYSTLTTETDSLYTDHTSLSYSERNSNSKRVFNANGLQFGFKQLFPKEGESLTADMNYFSGKNSNEALYTTNYFSNGPGSDISSTSQQKVIGGGKNSFLTVQTDYVKPFSTKTKLETGLRFNQQKLTNINDNYFYNDAAQDFVLSSSTASNYKNTNRVYAAYVSVSSGYKDFSYQVGLRAESSKYDGELTDTKQQFSNKYPASLFPSVFLSQKLANRQELQVSYTRRINRPNFFQLIPYTDYTDSLNITRGNPDLRPEFTNSLEFSYLKTYGTNNTFLASAYYKKTTDLITSYIDTGLNELTGKSDLIKTYVNANYSRTVGAEFTSVNTLAKWWDLTVNINIYNSEINTKNVTGATSQDPMWSWFGKLNSNFTLPGKIKLQITGVYQSKTNLPVNTNTQQMGPPGLSSAQSSSQGFIRPFWSTDLAVSRSFLKGDALNLSVSMSDVFRTRWQKQYSYSNYFVQDYNRLRDPQLVRVNLSFRFGKMDVSLFKRKNMSSAAEGASQMQQ